MGEIVDPWNDAEKQLEDAGVDFSDIPENKLTQAQLGLIVKGTGISPEVKAAAYDTVSRLNKGAKKQAKKKDITQKEQKESYKWEANVKNSMVGTQASINTQQAAQDHGDEMIKWLPSTAEEQDIQHSFFYGRKMTLDEAVNKHELGTRYGCKCSYEFI